jgi:hypothetical protein
LKIVAAIGRPASDLDLSGGDDVEPVAGLAFGEDHLAGPVVSGQEPFAHGIHHTWLEPLEDRGPAHRLIHASGRFRPGVIQ